MQISKEFPTATYTLRAGVFAVELNTIMLIETWEFKDGRDKVTHHIDIYPDQIDQVIEMLQEASAQFKTQAQELEDYMKGSDNDE